MSWKCWADLVDMAHGKELAVQRPRSGLRQGSWNRAQNLTLEKSYVPVCPFFPPLLTKNVFFLQNWAFSNIVEDWSVLQLENSGILQMWLVDQSPDGGNTTEDNFLMLLQRKVINLNAFFILLSMAKCQVFSNVKCHVFKPMVLICYCFIKGYQSDLG